MHTKAIENTKQQQFKVVFCIFTGFFLLPYYRKVMEVLFSVKIFDVEFSPDLYVLRSPESKKVAFGNWSVRMYVCACVRV